jgi:hypothetical protein
MNKLIIVVAVLMGALLEGSDVQGFAIPDLVMVSMFLLAVAMLVYVAIYGGDR